MLVVWSAWLWANPYQGIWHDARVYLVMAYRHLVPEAFERDVWFMFGSQDRSSLFDEIYAALLRWGPVDATAKLVALGGGVTWVIGAYWLAHAVIGGRAALWAAVFLSVLAPSYTFIDSKIFVLTEAFATARPYAMGLTLIGIASYLSGPRWIAVLTLVIGLALHPLMAVWGLLALAGYRLPDRAFGLIFALGVLLMVAGATAGLDPLRPMDELWFRLVQSTSTIVFAPSAESVALDRNFWWLAMLLLAGRLGAARFRKLYLVVACLAAWAFLASVILSFHYPAVLLAQAQPWRALWLAVAVGIVAAVDVVVRLWRSPNGQHWCLFIIATYILAEGGIGGTLLLAAWLLYISPRTRASLTSLWNHLSSPSQRFVYLIFILWLLGFFFISIMPFSYISRIFPGTDFTIEVPEIVTTLAIPLVLAWITSRASETTRIWLTTFVVLFALLLWDQRTHAQRLIESRYSPYGHATMMGIAYHQGDVVYWPENDMGPWFELATAGYAQNLQGIGIVFSRDHAILLYERLRRIRALQESTNWDQYFSEYDLHAPFYHRGQWSKIALTLLCMDPELDLVILSQQIDDATSDVTISQGTTGKRYVYKCSAFRNSQTAEVPKIELSSASPLPLPRTE
ncbi:hypothetical protein [Tepidimonas taiwanensis]|uniref:hypothetical protein n=1 Tax=Tepidimonas taiwanensis TaxID=307486 RepID=UPI00128ECCCD|nr:hypothetical protein [Tepidimonas taiwanensis]